MKKSMAKKKLVKKSESEKKIIRKGSAIITIGGIIRIKLR